MAQVLLAAGAEKEARDIGQCTPLHHVAMQGHGPVVQVLLTAGADKEAIADRQLTPLHLAAVKDHMNVVQVLLANGAVAEAQAMGASALAKQLGHHKIADMLKKAVHRQQTGLKECIVCSLNTSLRCQRCKTAPFCSRVCLKAGWRAHKEKCCGLVQK